MENLLDDSLVCSWRSCRREECRALKGDRDAAARFVNRLRDDRDALARMIDLIDEDDWSAAATQGGADPLERVARKIAAGELLVCSRPLLGRTSVESSGYAEQAPAEPPFPLSERRKAKAEARPKPKPRDEPTLPPVDSEAMAATLRDAAETGAPFCEICAK